MSLKPQENLCAPKLFFPLSITPMGKVAKNCIKPIHFHECSTVAGEIVLCTIVKTVPAETPEYSTKRIPNISQDFHLLNCLSAN